MVGRDQTRNGAGSGDMPRWRAGMRVRGGRVTHLVARVGWLVFGVAGIVLGSVVAVLFGLNEDEPQYGFAAAFIGGLILFVPICTVFAVLVGLGAQFGSRAWLRTAPPVVSRQEREQQDLVAQVGKAGLRADTRWGRHYANCLRAVSRFHDIVRELPDSAAGTWFNDIGRTLDTQLAEALRLAKLGDNLTMGTTGRNPSPTAVRIDASLQAAVTAFHGTTERAASIALELHGEADFTRVRSQLDMLQQQAPQLHQL